MLYYSISNNGFYDLSIFQKSLLPSDAVEIDDNVYQQLRIGLKAGGKVENKDGVLVVTPPTAESFNVSTITRAQGKKQLIAVALYDEVKAWVDNEASEMCRIGFYDEPYWLIDDEFIQEAKVKFNLTDERVQELFNLASKI